MILTEDQMTELFGKKVETTNSNIQVMQPKPQFSEEEIIAHFGKPVGKPVIKPIDLYEALDFIQRLQHSTTSFTAREFQILDYVSDILDELALISD